MKTRILAVAVIGAVALSLTACSTSDKPAPALHPTRLQQQLIDLYNPPASLEDARSAALLACLNNDGFKVPAQAASPTVVNRPDLFGIGDFFVSRAAAAKYGYTREVPADAADTYEKTLGVTDRQKFEAAISGDPSAVVSYVAPGTALKVTKPAGGCSAQADIAVYGDVDTALQLENFSNAVFGVVAKGQPIDEVVATFDGYDQCMKSAGISTTSVPSTAKTALARFGSDKSRPSAAESKLAVEDYKCQAASRIPDALNRLFFKTYSGWILGMKPIIQQLAAKQASALARVKAG